MYANAMKSGLEEENYDPLVAILHSTTGEVLYSNKPDVHIPLKPDGIERFTEDGETGILLIIPTGYAAHRCYRGIRH